MTPTDGDQDGVDDEQDACPDTPPGSSVGDDGCPPPLPPPPPDADGDGVVDAEDQCPGTAPSAEIDAAGCAADQRDSDGDGVPDGTDSCPETTASAVVDASGCSAVQRAAVDDDGDGVSNGKDRCPGTRPGRIVDAVGCADDQRDSDRDGVTNHRDQCPGTLFDSDVDATGCAASQRDGDGDGVSDDLDQCSDTPAGAVVDSGGCAADQRDADGDGVNDAADACPGTPSGSVVNAQGCSDSQLGGGGAPTPAGGGCVSDLECADTNGCTTDACSGGSCTHTPVPGCVTCDVAPTCPPVDVVFVMDTSGSMTDEAAALCGQIGQLITSLNASGFDVTPTYLGITEIRGGPFSCLTDDVVTLLGPDVPGSPGQCDFPQALSSFESWGPATAIIAERFAWRSGATRVIVPISDEGPCNGNLPDGCNDPGDDRDSVVNAAAVANQHGVIVSPISGTGSTACVTTLASDLAAATGGISFSSTDPLDDLEEAVAALIDATCLPGPCDDDNACTVEDLCRKGVCSGTSEPGCEPCKIEEDCDDNNLCTDDLCDAGICAHPRNYHSSIECCDPITGALVPIDDGDVCTLDLCDPLTGLVEHAPSTGNKCNDGLGCTRNDRCVEGVCSGTDVNGTTCATSSQCSPGFCNLLTQQCECSSPVDLCVVPVPKVCSRTGDVCLTDAECPTGNICICANHLDPDCTDDGQTIDLTIHMGRSQQVVGGGQFLLEYDPTCLDFVSIGQCLDDNVFNLPVAIDVNEAIGRIFYAVLSEGFRGLFAGTQGPHDLVCLKFRFLDGCTTAEVCIIDENPKETILTDTQGNEVRLNQCPCPDGD